MFMLVSYYIVKNTQHCEPDVTVQQSTCAVALLHFYNNSSLLFNKNVRIQELLINNI